MKAAGHDARWKLLLAYAVIYFVWGSTFFAIRVGVSEFPPLLMAALRFLAAGVALYAWVALRGERNPQGKQWASILLLAFLMFAVDYGLLFWAEQRVPSGLAAVMLATIPAFMALAEIALLRTQRLTPGLVLALVVGTGGVASLVSHSLLLPGKPIDRAGAVALIVAALSWSVASVLTRKLPLPTSKGMTSATQMASGGAMLAVAAAARGELRGFHPAAISSGAWFALGYLVVAGSIVAYTAYVWLIHREPPTRVGTYAYVNPLVAVVIGYFLGGEALGVRALLGTACILASVVMITTRKAPKPVAEEVRVR
jgi:drug/metabolite transporter (DMT)-like permease